MNKYNNYSYLKKYLYIILCFSFTNLFSQDAFFAIQNSAYLYNNPANTGNTGDLRFNNVYKNQFSILQGNYNTNFLSVDLNKNNQGFGAYFLADQAGAASVRKLELAGMYSYMSQLTDKLAFSFGLGIGGGQSRLNFNSATFEDQLQSDFSINPTSTENVSNTSIGYFEINSGVMLFSDNFWLGVSGHHLNKPKIYSIEKNAKLSRKFGIQSGYIYKIGNNRIINKNIENNNELIFSINSNWQGKVQRATFGAKLIYQNIVGTINISNIQIEKINIKGTLVGAGINYEMFMFVYGYEFYLGNKLKVGGSHEIQLKITLFHDNKINNYSFKNKKRLKTFCPLK